ncbi:MAG: putative oligosaccharide transporter permease protein [Ilumatobacteraceae bacterium]|nr:putative oligosaccharide transporter permease protein [Ilumatobacteraceae bacterium]
MTAPSTLHVFEWKLMVYRRVWRANLMTSLLQPILYLLAMGLGVGALVNKNGGSAHILDGIPYIAFVAPGLLATTAMMVCAIESLWPVHDAMKWGRQYEAMSATPLQPGDIVAAHLLWLVFRAASAAGAVAVVMAFFPDVRSWGLISAVPAATLGGVAIGMPFSAWAVTRDSDQSFPVIQRFIIVPLFLFGGAFFPLSQLPVGVRVVGYATPLWHAVEMCRSWVSGTHMSALAALGHTAYLLVFVVAGSVAMRHLARKRLFA